ncbi:hypothetical protein LEP1GSC037_0656 [Leptospira interrogans str. 2006001854]|uniref:Peptidase A24, N-terminal domain protein n=1 Tax=Leptospira interrogans str. 2006001854 TaxID=1001590 RepID=M6GAW9_LEPIR|nr:hypothetical protein LEP1GSC037_0656 [Leptospira interrogans str. 2006001854]
MLISPDSFPFWIILGFGSLGAASLGSFYVTLGFRILETYYGKQRKLLTFFQKWKRIFTLPSSCDHCGKKYVIRNYFQSLVFLSLKVHVNIVIKRFIFCFLWSNFYSFVFLSFVLP